jgi:polysaccharide biosynthesis protein PslH
MAYGRALPPAMGRVKNAIVLPGSHLRFNMILWISPYFFIPADSGSKIRVFNLLKNLSFKKNIAVISFYDKEKEKPPSAKQLAFAQEYVNNVKVFERKPINKFIKFVYALFYRFPLQVISFRVKAAEEEIKRLVATENIKIIQADEIYTAQYLFTVKNVKRVLVLHNVDSLVFWRLFREDNKILNKLYYLLQFMKMRRFEIKIIPKVDKCFCVSNHDREILSRIFKGSIDFEVIPNGVDTIKMQVLPPIDTPTLIFIGVMGDPQNIQAVEWFIKKVYTLVLKAIPEAFLFVVGSDPPERLKELEESYPVMFTGYVESVEEWYKKAKIAIVPLLVGSGTKLKILEANAYGRPVITTSIGVEGLEFQDGVDILIANHPEDFAKKILLLLRDNNYYHRIALNARRNVEENYDWIRISYKLENYYTK